MKKTVFVFIKSSLFVLIDNPSKRYFYPSMDNSIF